VNPYARDWPYHVNSYGELTVTLPIICVALFCFALALWYFGVRFRALGRKVDQLNQRLGLLNEVCPQCKRTHKR